MFYFTNFIRRGLYEYIISQAFTVRNLPEHWFIALQKKVCIVETPQFSTDPTGYAAETSTD